MPNVEAYMSILGKIGKTYPADYEGRGLFKGELIYEYQTAQIYPKDNLLEFIKRKIVEIKANNPNEADRIPVLPDVITLDMLKENELSFKKYPIGINRDTLKKEYWNFETSKASIITSNDIDSMLPFLNGFIDICHSYNNLNTILIDAEKVMENCASKVKGYICDSLSDNIKKLTEELNENVKALIIIVGVEKLKNSVEAVDFTNFFNKIKSCSDVRLVYVETQFKLKKFAFEGWYTETIVSINGIWIGNGVLDQGIISITDFNTRYKIKIDNSFAWVIRNGLGELIKCHIDSGEKNEE